MGQRTEQLEGPELLLAFDDGALLVKPVGELDLVAEPELVASVCEALRRESRTLIHVDLSAVTFLDSSGLRALLTVRHAALEVGALLTSSGPTEEVRRVIAITGLSHALGLQD